MLSNRETVIKLIRKELGLPEDRSILPPLLLPAENFILSA